MKKFIVLLAATCLMFLSPVMAQKKVFKDLEVTRSIKVSPSAVVDGLCNNCPDNDSSFVQIDYLEENYIHKDSIKIFTKSYLLDSTILNHLNSNPFELAASPGEGKIALLNDVKYYLMVVDSINDNSCSYGWQDEVLIGYNQLIEEDFYQTATPLHNISEPNKIWQNFLSPLNSGRYSAVDCCNYLVENTPIVLKAAIGDPSGESGCPLRIWITYTILDF